MMPRKVAVRIPAEEILSTTAFFKPSDKERYAITPLGFKVSRVVLAGVLTLKAETKPGSGIYKALLYDGVRSISCYTTERYNPEAVATLNNMQEPTWAVVIGKIRPIQTQTRIIPIIRFEHIRPVDKMDVMMWRLEVIKALKEQIDAYKRNVTEEIKIAKEHYGEVDFNKYEKLINDFFDKVREELTISIALPKEKITVSEELEQVHEKEVGDTQDVKDRMDELEDDLEDEIDLEDTEFDLSEILND